MQKTRLEKKVASTEKLVELTNNDLPRISIHLYTIAHQFTRIKELKDSLAEDQVVVHFDYSENYNCKWSKEIKDTHFGGCHKPVTLHTGVLYCSEGQSEACSGYMGTPGSSDGAHQNQSPFSKEYPSCV